MGRDNTAMESTTSSGITSEPLVIRGLFDTQTHNGIKQFINEQMPMLFVHEDNDVFVRTYANNVPFFVAIHRQLTDFASEIFGEKVKPSYSFLSMYKDNGTCPLHIDREQCRYTIDYLIQQDSTEPWPIHIGDHMSDDARWECLKSDNGGHPEEEDAIANRISLENWHEALLAPNDAVCYSGTHSWHYRPKRLVGSADLVFFHFVPFDFDGSLN